MVQLPDDAQTAVVPCGGPEGGLGEAVMQALALAGASPAKYQMIAVTQMPHSGKPDELIEAFGISARHIVEAVKAIA